MSSFPQIPPLLRLSVTDGDLCGVFVDGVRLLYRYAPLRGALISGQGVPFASLWPEHLKFFVYHYVPVPPLPDTCMPPELAAQFGVRLREASGLRPGPQVTYCSWPLYYCTLDAASDVPGAVSPLFQRVPLDILPLPSARGLAIGP